MTKLNGLQVRTLALLQQMARQDDIATTDAATGEVTIHQMPHIHGDHVHVGHLTVPARFASGLANPNVWSALERKGLVRGEFPHQITLTADGVDYPTGIAEQLLDESDH